MLAELVSCFQKTVFPTFLNPRSDCVGDACTDGWTGEAESPPAHKAYDLRPRASSTPQSTPGFGKDATPEAVAAAERAASITQGPIKKRLKVLSLHNCWQYTTALL